MHEAKQNSVVHVRRRLQSVASGQDPREICLAMVVVVAIAVMIGAVVFGVVVVVVVVVVQSWEVSLFIQ